MRLDVPIVRQLLGLVHPRPVVPEGETTVEPPPTKAMRVAARVERLAAKERAVTERARRREEKAALLAEEARVHAEVSGRAYGHYLRVRDWARGLSMASRSTVAATPFARVGTDPSIALAHLWDAPPETIEDLRRWCEPISGVRKSDYEPASNELTRQVQREWMALRSHRGAELLVQEAPTLGGFGILRNGQRVNLETLRSFAAAIALQDGGIFEQFQAGRRRQLVWEIGGGWGGFAYAFRTLCPNTTYLITGVPETLLVSAVYLMTVFPEARCRFFEPERADLWRDWQDVDFVFAPEWALPALDAAPIDLTIDVMALRAMHADGIRAHVRQAYDSRSLYFYSLLPAAHAPDDAARVWNEIGRLYWPHPVPPRGMDGIAYPPPAAPEGYVHLVGWRRMRP